MGLRRHYASLASIFLILSTARAYAQLRPEVTPPAPKKAPARVKPAQIVVETSPDANVYIDDVFKGQASPQGRLVIDKPKPGDHALRVSLAGKRNHEQKVTAIAGEVTKITAVLADSPGTLVVQTSPGAAVFLDDSSRGTTDATGQLSVPDVAAGSHELRIAVTGKKDYRQNISVPAGHEARVEARLEDVGPPPPGTLRENPKDGLKYVWIPPGTFMMGCSPGDDGCDRDEKPAHQVMITKGFWLGQTEVTVGAYKRFPGGTGKHMPSAPSFNPGWSNEQMPILNVSWKDAQAYCAWAGGRLPTEAEWEYAARGGSTEARYGSLDEVAWYGENSGMQTHPVGGKRANGFGLFDSLGNVWEWVNDWYDEKYYQSSPSQDPAGPTSGELRVLRGGSWLRGPVLVRASYRRKLDPGTRIGNGSGVRCAREADIP